MAVRVKLESLEIRALMAAMPITFGPIANYRSGDQARHLVAGDFNHDGYADLAVVNTNLDSNSVSILMNNGNGTFAAPVQYRITFSADKNRLGAENIAVGDFNGDGNLDLAITTRNPNTGSTNLINLDRIHDGLTLLFGVGDGTFGNQTDYRIAHGTRQLAVADLNGDGRPDLVIGAIANLGVALNNGDGSFSTETIYPAGFGPANGFATADFNGDGLTDIVMSKGDDKSVRVFLNRGAGTFGVGERIQVDGVALGVTTGDFNGDGNADIAVGNSQFRQGISVLLSNGAGTFTKQPKQRASSFLEDVVAADLNGDGIPDLAGVDFTTSVKTLVGNGDGTFGDAVLQPGGTESFYIVAADFNNDGKIDLAWTRHNRVNVLLNTTP